MTVTKWPKIFSNFLTVSLISLFSFSAASFTAQAAQLAIIIDDFGYRKQDDNKIMQLPPAVSIAILPNSPQGKEMATLAHQQGREVLIHMPMAPISKQPLEKDTLQPTMSAQEIDRLVNQAIQKVPYAVGMNNHMGSAMTSDLAAMQHVMKTLSSHKLYFLDSVTIGSTKVTQAAQGTPVKVLRRQVFLDNVQTEEETRKQLNRAINIARKQGSVIAIGHPHPSTVRALHKLIPTLPADIQLVAPSQLLSAKNTESKPAKVTPEYKGKWIKQPSNTPAVIANKPTTESKLVDANKLVEESTLADKNNLSVDENNKAQEFAKELSVLPLMSELCEIQLEPIGRFYVRYMNLVVEGLLTGQLTGKAADILLNIPLALPQGQELSAPITQDKQQTEQQKEAPEEREEVSKNKADETNIADKTDKAGNAK